MKRKTSLFFIAITLVLSAIFIKDNRVSALKERACIGDGCSEEIKSHTYYSNFWGLGLKYVVSDYFTFEYDYYLSTYVNYTNGKITSVDSPVITHGSTFLSQSADYNVGISTDFDYEINSNGTSADCVLTITFTMTGQIPSYIVCEPVVIEYTVS